MEILDQLLREASASPLTLDELTYDLNERLVQQAGASDAESSSPKSCHGPFVPTSTSSAMSSALRSRCSVATKKGATYCYENPFQSRHHAGLSPDEANDVKLMLRKLRRFISQDQMRFITQGQHATNPFNSLLRLFSPKAKPISDAFIEEPGAPVLFDSVVQLYKGAKYIEVLAEAIGDRRVVQVVYQPFGKPKYEAFFHPYVLKQYNNRWFCIGHNPNPDFAEYRKSNPYSTMALDRIQGGACDSNEPTGTGVERRAAASRVQTQSIADWDAEVFEYLVGPSWPEGVWETPSRMKRPEPIEVAFSPTD